MAASKLDVSYRPQIRCASLVAFQRAVVARGEIAGLKEIFRRFHMLRIPENEKLAGPVLALDVGEKRVGIAVSDALLISINTLPTLDRTNWKQMLRDIRGIVERLDVKALVIGFPLSLNGAQGPAARAGQEIAENFALSLSLPVYLQDERLTSVEAEEQLRAAGRNPSEIRGMVDGQAAAIILSDFLAGGQDRLLISRQQTKNEETR